jgi:DnaJ-class molecular chaperone
MVIASVLLLAALACYATLCTAKPFAPCRRCGGTGKTERFGEAHTCPRCHGRKYRLRLGRRAHNAWRRSYGDGTR